MSRNVYNLLECEICSGTAWPLNDSDRLITFETDAAFEDNAVTSWVQKPYSPLKYNIHIMSEYLSQFAEKRKSTVPEWKWVMLLALERWLTCNLVVSETLCWRALHRTFQGLSTLKGQSKESFIYTQHVYRWWLADWTNWLMNVMILWEVD